jgi:hypothetical protein
MKTTTFAPKVNVRPLYEIAKEINKDWSKVYFGAVPYLNAMYSLELITDRYGLDSGKSIVAYFLSNASTWKGETAKRVKLELNAMLKK